jgi:hypothetical protein
MITLITPTGSRPQAFALCEKYMARQTYKGDIQWVIIDDSPNNPTVCTMNQEYYVGPLEWKVGINTQRYSLDLAIKKVHKESNAVFIIEDDDFFHKSYLETQLEFLKHADMVGECGVTYYSLKDPHGFMEMKNYNHASTTSTAFRRSYLPNFYKAVHSGNVFFDIYLWNTAKMNNHKVCLHHGLNLLVGIKGLGRAGIGVGHSSNEFIPDPHFVILKKLLGEDAEPYINIMKGIK